MDELFSKYPPTRHLSGSGLAGSRDSCKDRVDWAMFAGRNAVFEEKIDGSHSGFFFDGAGEPHMLARGNELDMEARGGSESHFDLMKDWLRAHEPSLLERVEDRYVIFGEWCRHAHTVYYDRLPHLFLEFDVLDRMTGEYFSTPRRRNLLEGLPIVSVPVLFEGPVDVQKPPEAFVSRSLFKSETWRQSRDLAAMAAGLDVPAAASRFEDNDLAEGIYVKIEEDGHVVERLKWVRDGFVRHIVEGGRHWSGMPAVANALEPGADIFAQMMPRPR